MVRLLVHAGRHKTGTTALQAAFVAEKDLLSEFGVFYPSVGTRGNAHHELAEALTPKGIKHHGGDSRAEKMLVEIVHQSFKLNADTILLSSEAFQNCNPETLKYFFKGLEPEIIFYIRNKIDYAVSSYSQKISATDYPYSMERFVQDDFRLDYKEYFQKWLAVFGEKIYLNKYARETENFNIVTDFFGRYISESLPSSSIETMPRINESLGLEALLLKRAMNSMVRNREYSGLDWRSITKHLNDVDFAQSKVRITLGAFSELLAKLPSEDVFLKTLPGFESGFSYELGQLSDARIEDLEYELRAFVAPQERRVLKHLERVIRRLQELHGEHQKEQKKILDILPFPTQTYGIVFNREEEILADETHVSHKENNVIPALSSENFNHAPIDLREQLSIQSENIISLVSNVSVLMPEGLVLKNSSMLSGSAWMSKARHLNDFATVPRQGRNLLADESFFKRMRDPSRPHLSGLTLYAYVSVGKNYYHWHFEVLARIYEYLRSGSMEDVDRVFVGDVSPGSYKLDSLVALGIPEQKIVTGISGDFRLERAVVPTLRARTDRPLLQGLHPNGAVHHKGWTQDFCTNFAEVILKGKTPVTIEPKKRLFVNRGKGETRRIINEAEVLSMMVDYGFEIIDASMLSYNEQLNLFSKAEIVFGIHGAGLTNCLWMQKGGALLELVPKSYPDVGYGVLASLKGLSYYRIDCDTEGDSNSGTSNRLLRARNADIFVDIGNLELYVQTLLRL